LFVFSLLRRHRLFFAIATAVAIAFRAFLVYKFRLIDGDSLIYGDIAKNWLTHGVFGVSTAGGPMPTWIRLPGYPAFLAAIWAVVGVEHYTAVLIAQVLVDVATCFVVADLARRIVSQHGSESERRRTARVAFILTAICPFLAIYTAAPLSETLAVFCAALALDAAAASFDGMAEGRMRAWVLCGFAVGAGILLRPDGGILLVAIGAWLGWHVLGRRADAAASGTEASTRAEFSASERGRRLVMAGVIVAGIAVAALVPWTVRNWRTFHAFQPLAPRYANAPNEAVNYGYQRWTKTWMVDFVSVAEVYWQMPDQQIDTELLPSRAFDTPEERERTEEIFSRYTDQGQWTPEMDAALGQIADERIARAPLRYYVWLPAARIADMWLRPRTDLTRVNDRWWEYSDDLRGALWGTLLGVINLLYVGAAACAVAFRGRRLRFLGLLLTFVVLRSLFLGSLENPETRYTLECYPVVLALASCALAASGRRALEEERTAG
jgi:Dolichyl-phosphate-mannose-protein mannosyltransferase